MTWRMPVSGEAHVGLHKQYYPILITKAHRWKPKSLCFRSLAREVASPMKFEEVRVMGYRTPLTVRTKEESGKK